MVTKFKNRIVNFNPCKSKMDKKDIVIDILEFGKSNLISNATGISFDAIKAHLKDKGYTNDMQIVVACNNVLNACFSIKGAALDVYTLNIESYFSLLEYTELQEARASSKQANIYAIIAFVLTLISLVASVYYSNKQLESPTEIKKSQMDTIILIHKELHQDLLDTKKTLSKIQENINRCDTLKNRISPALPSVR